MDYSFKSFIENRKSIKEGNPFIFAAAKAKQDGKDEFEYKGKKYKVTLKADTGLGEGNAFSNAVKNAKDANEQEFEFEGKTYKVKESEKSEEVKETEDGSGETAEEPKAPKLMSFDEFVKDKSTTDKADDESGEKVATSDEVDAKLPSEDKEKEDLEDKEAKDDAKGEEEEEEEEEEDLDDLDA